MGDTPQWADKLHWGVTIFTLCNIPCVRAYLICMPQHTPLSRAQSHCQCMLFKLGCRQSLGENIGGIPGSRAILDRNCPVVRAIMYGVVSDVNMLGACMILCVLQDCDCWLVVTEQCGWVAEWPCDFHKEGLYPKGFLCCMHKWDVLSLSCGQRNKTLFFRAPGYSTTINHKDIAADWMVVLLRGPVSVTEALEPTLAIFCLLQISDIADYQWVVLHAS